MAAHQSEDRPTFFTTCQTQGRGYPKPRRRNGRSRLFFCEVAGSRSEAPPLANADAVFFMFDPLRVEAIRDQLHDLIPPQAWSGGDPRSVLSNLLLAVGGGRPRLAVIMAKFDVLRALTAVEGSAWSRVMSNAGAAFMRDSSASGRYNEAEGRLLHEEVRSLLLRLHGGSIVAGVENPSSGIRLDHRYFAVSSLGQPPVGNRLNPRGIAPFRCIDPLRWATASLGVL